MKLGMYNVLSRREAGLAIEDCFKQDGKWGEVWGGTDFFLHI